jgi:hypothetical protein
MVDSCEILAAQGPLCYAASVMPWLRTLPLLALVVGVGCQTNTIHLETDPGADDDDGDEPTDSTASPTTTGGSLDTDTGPDDTTTTGGPGGPQMLLFAINTPLAPGLPFQAIVNATPGTGTIDLTIQFLSLDQGSTTSPRQLVGDVYAYPGLLVDGTGTFYWDTGVILIPGAANPITGGDVVASIQSNVVPVGTPAYCGQAGGTVLMPVETTLEGSTHAMTVVTDVGNLPVDFAVACP